MNLNQYTSPDLNVNKITDATVSCHDYKINIDIELVYLQTIDGSLTIFLANY